MELAKVFDNFLLREGAKSAEVIEAYTALGMRPSAEYMAVLEFTNGGEGFIGQNYLRLYSTDELLAFNHAYQVSRFAPDLVLFGSTGYGEAYAFDKRQASSQVMRIPFIPLDLDYAKTLYANFEEFIHALFEAKRAKQHLPQPQIEMTTVGKELHHRQSLAFGGSPTDPQNRILVSTAEYAEICVFWNGVWHNLKSKTKP